MVTAEIAVALPALVLTTLLLLTGVRVASAQLRVLDAAEVAARLAARGEAPGSVTAAAKAACPAARVQVHVVAETVVADAEMTVAPAGVARLLPELVVRERAVYALEPAAPP
jgi:hypothetical protein